MSESGLPTPKRNLDARNRDHEPWAPTSDTRPRTAINAHTGEKRTHTPQLSDLGSTAGEGLKAGSATLAAFIQFHPCMTYFCCLPDIQYPPGRGEAKVWRLRHD